MPICNLVATSHAKKFRLTEKYGKMLNKNMAFGSKCWHIETKTIFLFNILPYFSVNLNFLTWEVATRLPIGVKGLIIYSINN